MIPFPYKLAGLTAAVAALFASGYYAGSRHIQTAWDEAKADQVQHVEHVQVAQAAATVQTITQYVDRIKTVSGPTQEVLRAIPTYLPVDAQCPAAVGLLIKSAEDGVSVPPGPVPTDAAPTSAAAVAEWGVETIEAFRENAEQLKALQSWIQEVSATK